MSSHPSKSYRELMNYIHNELGITKQDIKDWVQAAIKEVAESYIEHQFSQQSLDQRIMNLIRDKTFSIWGRDHETLEKYIKDKAAAELIKGISVDVKVRKPKP